MLLEAVKAWHGLGWLQIIQIVLVDGGLASGCVGGFFRHILTPRYVLDK